MCNARVRTAARVFMGTPVMHIQHDDSVNPPLNAMPAVRVADRMPE